MPNAWLQHAWLMLIFYQSCSAFHNIYRAKFCATGFLCPTVGELGYSVMLTIYIVTWLYIQITDRGTQKPRCTKFRTINIMESGTRLIKYKHNPSMLQPRIRHTRITTFFFSFNFLFTLLQDSSRKQKNGN